MVLTIAFEDPTLYGVEQLLALDALTLVAGLDDDVAVRVEVVAGLDGLDREVVVDVGEDGVQTVAGETVQLFPSAFSSNGSERAFLAFFAASSASAVVTSGSSVSPLRRALPLMSSMARFTLAMVAARLSS